MIGNDIVDLNLAKIESNWKRKGFLEKIFTEKEQKLIQFSENPEQMVWILWSGKESAYKIHNRATLVRSFIPLQLECELDLSDQFTSGKVSCFGHDYFFKTEVEQDYIYTIAVTNPNHFQNIKEFGNDFKIIKKNGIPYLYESKSIISITHHGKFDRRISLEL